MTIKDIKDYLKKGIPVIIVFYRFFDLPWCPQLYSPIFQFPL
jgi:hypothetical protein